MTTPAPGLIAALREMRRAEIEHGACVLGLLAGDRGYLSDKMHEALRQVRILVDAQKGEDIVIVPRSLLTDASAEINRLSLLAGLVTVRQVINAGDKYIEASGLNPWCMNEGLASGDEKIDAGNSQVIYDQLEQAAATQGAQT